MIAQKNDSALTEVVSDFNSSFWEDPKILGERKFVRPPAANKKIIVLVPQQRPH